MVTLIHRHSVEAGKYNCTLFSLGFDEIFSSTITVITIIYTSGSKSSLLKTEPKRSRDQLAGGKQPKKPRNFPVGNTRPENLQFEYCKLFYADEKEGHVISPARYTYSI